MFSEGGQSRGEVLGASSTDNGWGGVSAHPYWGSGDFSSISSHSIKGIYFLMALALSHEAGILSFKGTESSLLAHRSGSLKSSAEFQGDHCKASVLGRGL